MILDDIKYTKSICEKYNLRFNDGHDFATFVIDNTGLLQCHSSFGSYSYKWGAFGNDFKKFLCEIDNEYLINKTSNKDYFDFEKYQKKAFNAIVEERRNKELTKLDARELWYFVENLDQYNGSYDLVCEALYENTIINNLYDGEVFYSNFCPELDYGFDAKIFAYKIFPEFIKILKKE